MYIRLGMTSFRNFYEFISAGATDGANKIGGQFLAFKSEDTIVASVFFHLNRSLISGLAVAAQAGHGQVAAFYLTAGEILSLEAEACGYFNLRQVQYGIAAGAEEVDVGCGVGIKPFGAVYGSDADDQALLFEECQIPVDRCLRDVRVGFLQHLVNHFGGRMCVCVHQTV